MSAIAQDTQNNADLLRSAGSLALLSHGSTCGSTFLILRRIPVSVVASHLEPVGRSPKSQGTLSVKEASARLMAICFCLAVGFWLLKTLFVNHVYLYLGKTHIIDESPHVICS